MRVVCFVDLDDTIIQTETKCPPGVPLKPVAVDRQGVPISFMTPSQVALWKLVENSELIPTTGRTLEALQRVHLRFESYRITNHGAVVTDRDGNPDPHWASFVYPALEAREEQLRDVAAAAAEVSRRLDLRARSRVIREHEVPTYVSVKCENEADLARLAGELDLASWGPGLRLHRNGRNMAVLPAETSKRAAVAHVSRRLRESEDRDLLTIGMGDSLSDTPFLLECDFAVVPQRSQLAAVLESAARERE